MRLPPHLWPVPTAQVSYYILYGNHPGLVLQSSPVALRPVTIRARLFVLRALAADKIGRLLSLTKKRNAR